MHLPGVAGTGGLEMDSHLRKTDVSPRGLSLVWRKNRRAISISVISVFSLSPMKTNFDIECVSL